MTDQNGIGLVLLKLTGRQFVQVKEIILLNKYKLWTVIEHIIFGISQRQKQLKLCRFHELSTIPSAKILLANSIQRFSTILLVRYNCKLLTLYYPELSSVQISSSFRHGASKVTKVIGCFEHVIKDVQDKSNGCYIPKTPILRLNAIIFGF